MANETREVKVKITADDETGKGFNSAARRAQDANEKIRKEQDKTDKHGRGIGKGLTEGIGKAAAAIGSSLAKVGVSAGSKLGDSISNGVSGASPQIQGALGAALIAGAAYAAPLIGATIAGAVTGAAGLTGIVGGVVLAARDARVKAAGAALGQNLLGGLSTQASPFIRPVLDAIDLIQRRFNQNSSQIGQGFAAAARYVVPLTDAILDAGDAILTGLVASLKQAGPVIGALGNGTRTLGRTIEYMLVSFASVGGEGALAFEDLFKIIDFTIRQITFFITALAKAYGFVRTLGGLLGDTGDKANELGDAATGTAGDLLAFTEGLTGTDEAAAGAAGSMNALAGAIYATGSANLSLAEAQVASARANEAAKEAIDGTTTATLAEKEALFGTVRAYEAELTAMQATGASAEAVNAQSNTLRESFIKQAQAMGYSRAGAEALADSYGLIPKVVPTNFVVTGAEEARRQAERVRAAADSIPDQINIAIRVTGSEASRQAIQSALAKQSMMADAGAQWHAEQTAFAATGGATGMTRMAGARDRVGPIAMTSDVRVSLDGRMIAPMVTTTAKRLDDRQAWRAKRTRR